MLKIDATRLNKVWDSLWDKGPIIVVMSVVCFLLYGWVEQGRTEDKLNDTIVMNEMRAMRTQHEAYQKYVQTEVFTELRESRKVIEKNNYALEELTRQMRRSQP